MRRGLKLPPRYDYGLVYDAVSYTPPSIDWRKRGAVTAVGDQGHCGCCWAFGTAAAVEGLWAIKTKQLVRVSEEELIQCTRGIATDPPPSDGCHGGYKAKAFDWIARNGGIDTYEDYPFTSHNGTAGTCATSKVARKHATVDSHVSLPAGNESALLAAVLRQPVAAGIASHAKTFHLYRENDDLDADLGHRLIIGEHGQRHRPCLLADQERLGNQLG